MFKTILLTMAIAAILPGSSRNAIAEPLDLSQFQWKKRLGESDAAAPNKSGDLE